MKVDKVENITLRFDNQELSDLAYHIKRSISTSIKEHYSCLQQADLERSKKVFYEQCGSSLDLMKSFVCLSRGDDGKWLEDELVAELESEYNAKHKKD